MLAILIKKLYKLTLSLIQILVQMYIINSLLYGHNIQPSNSIDKWLDVLTNVMSWLAALTLIKFWTNIYDSAKNVRLNWFGLFQEV